MNVGAGFRCEALRRRLAVEALLLDQTIQRHHHVQFLAVPWWAPIPATKPRDLLGPLGGQTVQKRMNLRHVKGRERKPGAKYPEISEILSLDSPAHLSQHPCTVLDLLRFAQRRRQRDCRRRSRRPTGVARVLRQHAASAQPARRRPQPGHIRAPEGALRSNRRIILIQELEIVGEHERSELPLAIAVHTETMAYRPRVVDPEKSAGHGP